MNHRVGKLIAPEGLPEGTYRGMFIITPWCIGDKVKRPESFKVQEPKLPKYGSSQFAGPAIISHPIADSNKPTPSTEVTRTYTVVGFEVVQQAATAEHFNEASNSFNYRVGKSMPAVITYALMPEYISAVDVALNPGLRDNPIIYVTTTSDEFKQFERIEP